MVVISYHRAYIFSLTTNPISITPVYNPLLATNANESRICNNNIRFARSLSNSQWIERNLHMLLGSIHALIPWFTRLVGCVESEGMFIRKERKGKG